MVTRRTLRAAWSRLQRPQPVNAIRGQQDPPHTCLE